MAKPVQVPTTAEESEGIMRRRPEDVADSRRTAWKKMGMLNITAFCITAAIALP
jgi:hypothetical protein